MTVYQDIAGAKVGQPVTIEIGVDSKQARRQGNSANCALAG